VRSDLIELINVLETRCAVAGVVEAYAAIEHALVSFTMVYKAERVTHKPVQHLVSALSDNICQTHPEPT
jgi:hypothetical protein